MILSLASLVDKYVCPLFSKSLQLGLVNSRSWVSAVEKLPGLEREDAVRGTAPCFISSVDGARPSCLYATRFFICEMRDWTKSVIFKVTF